jgi:hypothetical protein
MIKDWKNKRFTSRRNSFKNQTKYGHRELHDKLTFEKFGKSMPL